MRTIPAHRAEESYENLRTWRHGGFSTDASVFVPAGDTAGLERVAAYVLRPPLSLARLTYTPGSKTAIYRTSHTPVTGGNFVALDAKELLVRLLIEKILRHLHRWDPPRAPPG